MKPMTLYTFVLLLLFSVAPAASRADSVVVGSLDLFNTLPGPDGLDTLLLTNVTGSGATGTPDQLLTFSNVELTIDGVNQTTNVVTDAAGLLYELDNLSQDSITSFDLTATLDLPSVVTVNGQEEEIDPMISLAYSGPALDTSSSVCTLDSTNCPHFDVTAMVTPEPSSLSLLGIGVMGALSLGLLFGFRAQE